MVDVAPTQLYITGIISASPTLISLANPRAYFYIRNVGATTITVMRGQTAGSYYGFVLANGDYYLETIDAQFRPFNGDLYVISDVDGGAVSFEERLMTRKQQQISEGL